MALNFINSTVHLAFMGLGPMEMMLCGIVAVMLFGSRLPTVARSMGKSFVEFKKGVGGIEDEFKSAVYSDSSAQVEYDNNDSTDSDSTDYDSDYDGSEPDEYDASSVGDENSDDTAHSDDTSDSDKA